MAINRKTCLSNIGSYLKEMRELVLRSGILEDRYDSIIERAMKLDDAQLGELQETLSDVMGLQWKIAYDVWILPSISNPKRASEVWAMYDAMELEGNPEQEMLKEKLKDLNIEIKRIMRECLRKRKKLV